MTFNAEETLQQNIIYQVDSNIERLQDVTFQLSSRKDISVYNLNTDIDKRMQIIEMLRYSLAIDSTIVDIIMSLDNEDLIYSSQGTFSISSYSKINQTDLYKILAYVNDPGVNSTKLIPIIIPDIPKDGKYLYFACKYPLDSVYPKGHIIFKVDSHKFIPLTENGYVVYYGDDILYKNINSEIQEIKEIKEINKNNIKLKCPYSYIVISSKNHMLKIVTAINNEKVFKSLFQTTYQFIITQILVFIFSISLLCYFSYQNYKPLNDLKNTLVKLGLKFNNDPNNFGEIPQSIQALEILSLNNKILDNQILKEKYIARELLLLKLINSQYEDMDKMKNELMQHDINTDSTLYTVCIFKLNTYALSNFYVNGVPIDQVNDNINIYFCNDMDNRIMALIGGDESLRNELNNLIESIIKRMGEQNILAEAHVGCIYTSICEADFSYIEAVSMINYDKFIHGNINVYKQSSVLGKHLFYPQAELNNLANAFTNNDSNNILLITETIAYQILNDIYDFSFSKTISYAVVNTFIKSLDNDSDNDLDFIFIRRYLSDLNKINTKRDIYNFIIRIVTDIVERKSLNTTTGVSKSKLDEIATYILEHCLDVDFFLGDVADKFGISLNNLSQQLKKQWNVSPMKYITTLRIEKAKELLASTEKSMKEISCLVGFSNIPTFARNFKSVTSITPGQYRDCYRSYDNK